MFKIIKNFNWIILSSFLCIFMGIITFLTFINEGFIPLTDENLQILLIIDIILLLVFFTEQFENVIGKDKATNNAVSNRIKLLHPLVKF